MTIVSSPKMAQTTPQHGALPQPSRTASYAILLGIYGRYDLVTLVAAIGTFALWWTNYPLFVMQRPIGATQPWIAFTVWGFGVAAAAALAFQHELRNAYRRAAALLN